MTTPELIQWLRDNSSGVYRPARDAADLLARMTDRETALVAALPPRSTEPVMDCRYKSSAASKRAPVPDTKLP